MENKNILIYAELGAEKLDPSCYELLSKSRSLFGDDAQLAVAVLGCGVEGAAHEAAAAGADLVFKLDDEKLAVYNVDYYSAALEEINELFQPHVILMTAGSTGEELAPTMGLRLNTGVAAHCVDLCLDDEGQLVQMVPAFGGKVIGEIYTPDSIPQIASVKPGTFNAEPLPQREAEIVTVSGRRLEDTDSAIRAISVQKKEAGSMPIEKAPVIVCGGFGVGSEENWQQLEKLAHLLGGTTGCTRPALDSGWTDDEQKMIGTSGKNVRPKVYIGSGVSGATHHVCGMKDSGVIISINNDEEAEMFKSSDYKVVADGAKIISALCDALEDR
ncbi:MAG: electron transfer flavoprotein subunit alpha/FixB family protein [Anaerovoracaceae bacterium]|jgi:electron transfer flavoprotein alpha subunit